MTSGHDGPPSGVELSCADLHDLFGAFVLDSLESPEALRVQRHLDGCADCRKAAEELRAVAMEIGENVVAVAPPPALRQRILTQVRAEARERPAQPRVSGSEPHRRSWSTGRWSPWIATAAAAVVALSAGSWALFEHYSSPAAQPGLTSVKLNPLDRLIASGNSSVIMLNPSRSSGAHGALVTDPSTGTTYLLLSSVPELRTRRVYALWYMALDNGSLTPVRIGQVKHAGAYRIGRSPNGFTRIALTREPRAGDNSPRGPVLLAAALS
ncbi:MAG: anti-sigma factor domain-containing protein [Candidatus Dormibacteria bacterium]